MENRGEERDISATQGEKRRDKVNTRREALRRVRFVYDFLVQGQSKIFRLKCLNQHGAPIPYMQSSQSSVYLTLLTDIYSLVFFFVIKCLLRRVTVLPIAESYNKVDNTVFLFCRKKCVFLLFIPKPCLKK